MPTEDDIRREIEELEEDLSSCTDTGLINWILWRLKELRAELGKFTDTGKF